MISIPTSKKWFHAQTISSCITSERTIRKKFSSCSSVDANRITLGNIYLDNILYAMILVKKIKSAWKFLKAYSNFMLILESIQTKSHSHVLKSAVADNSINLVICSSIFIINTKIQCPKIIKKMKIALK